MIPDDHASETVNAVTRVLNTDASDGLCETDMPRLADMVEHGAVFVDKNDDCSRGRLH